ncbi:MAG TPA: glycosyl hydrolase family 28-related protein [Lacunisphaera sp.]|nr:glycosyl hydrolase family 28-related protein [Lacunisphaera sp.]
MISLRLLLALTLSALTASAQVPARVFDVRAHGAKGDGVTLDSPAINAAIEAAAAAGGGTVHFPAGTYLSFSIRLKSNITLYLDSGATIEAARPPADLSAGYDAPEPNPGTDQYEDFGHSHWHNSLIWGEGLTHIAILGPGRIFGKGLSRGNSNRFDPTPEERLAGQKPGNDLPQFAKDLIAKNQPGPFGTPGKDTLPAGVGNKAIALKNCRNVIFRDFTLQHGGHFAILATGVDNWTVDNLTIDTNRDGIDFDCCQNVRVSNTSVNSPNDDAICPKSSYGLGYARMTENITITNCYVSGFDEGTLLDGTRKRRDDHIFGHGPTGRIKCGTESNGGFRNITISNCVFEYCRGLALESVDGAQMEDITVTNLTMRDIVNAPIFIRLGARLRGPEGTKVGTARRIKIDNVVVHNAPAEAGILLTGIPGYTIDDVSLSNIFIDYAGGGTAADAARVVPEDEKAYPEPYRFGKLSAWGLFARHLTNLTVDRVEFRAAQPDFRPVAWLEDVTGASFDRAKFPPAAGAPALLLKGVMGLEIHRCPGLPETQRPELIAAEKL